ncbi:MAG: VOC family protein, partial [Pseudomonadota bacterium]
MTDSNVNISLEPRLIIEDVDAALDFYSATIGANRLKRFTDQNGRVVHAAMQIGESVFTMAQAVADWGLTSPVKDMGASVLLH